MIAERIDAVQRQLEADNPGFAEYLAQQPEIPIVNLDDIVEQTDIYDARSVARSYFIFVYNEFARRNSGDIPQSTVELMLRLFEDAMVGDRTNESRDTVHCLSGMLSKSQQVQRVQIGMNVGAHLSTGCMILRGSYGRRGLHDGLRRLEPHPRGGSAIRLVGRL